MICSCALPSLGLEKYWKTAMSSLLMLARSEISQCVFCCVHCLVMLLLRLNHLNKCMFTCWRLKPLAKGGNWRNKKQQFLWLKQLYNCTRTKSYYILKTAKKMVCWREKSLPLYWILVSGAITFLETTSSQIQDYNSHVCILVQLQDVNLCWVSPERGP